jgi:hypothetical protein
MDDSDIDVPAVVVFLGFELLVDPLRPGITRPGADRPDGDARMVPLEHRTEIIFDVVHHVLVAGGDEVKHHGLLSRGLRRGQSPDGDRRQRYDDDANSLHCVLPASSCLL